MKINVGLLWLSAVFFMSNISILNLRYVIFSSKRPVEISFYTWKHNLFTLSRSYEKRPSPNFHNWIEELKKDFVPTLKI